MELLQRRNVIRRKTGKPGDIAAGVEFVAITKKVRCEVSAVPEVIHDVGKVGRVG